MNRSAVIGFLALAAVVLAPPAQAQGQYPSKPVRFLVPFDPGTGPDIIARTLGPKLADRWGVPVVVENRAGASGSIGFEAAAKSTADGYTIVVTANTFVLGKSLRPSAPYDPVREFAPVAPLAIGRLAMVVHPSMGVSSVKDLVAAASAKPGSIDYASPGNGTPHHLAMELFRQTTGIDLMHIPHPTTGGALQSLLSGNTKLMFLPIHVALPHIQARKLVVLSAGGVQRAAATPEVPSLAEASGIRDIDADIWFGMYVPAATSAPVIAKLNADVNAALELKDVREGFGRQGLLATGGRSEALGELTRTELEKWTRVVREAKISVN
jgi:tripartite-type tricarboxylate transporter receptor subunit TctC